MKIAQSVLAGDLGLTAGLARSGMMVFPHVARRLRRWCILRFGSTFPTTTPRTDFGAVFTASSAVGNTRRISATPGEPIV